MVHIGNVHGCMLWYFS